MTDVTANRQFDMLFDATIGDESVRAFLADANLAAARAMADEVRGGDPPGFVDNTPQLGRADHGRSQGCGRVNAPAIKGWCPGVLSPMESGDGLIVRLKLTGGIVPLDLAGQIAQWSRRWGNGQIDLTGRANLQLRGVTSENLPDLQDALRSPVCWTRTLTGKPCAM